MINLSIVVPLFNEEESLPELCAWIKRVCDKEQLSYEVLLLDELEGYSRDWSQTT